MPFLRQILADRAVTEVVLLRAPRASTPFEYDILDAMVHESNNPLSALATITLLKQRQRPKNEYPREGRKHIALIYCKRSDSDDIPMLEDLLHHMKRFHPEIGIWCIPQDDLVIEVNTGVAPVERRHDKEPPDASLPPEAGSNETSGYGTLKFRGSFVQPHDGHEGHEERETEETEEVPVDDPESVEDAPDLTRSENFEDPDSTEKRTDPTVSLEELELLFRDSDEDHEDGISDSETSEDSGP